MKGDIVFGCGQCFPCRFNKRREHTHRIMLESMLYEDNCFVTLTYAPEFLPQDLSVNPRTLTLYIKRLREALRPRTFRHFSVGEYGDISDRPHYHLALFGVSPNDFDAIGQAWNMGMVHVGTLTLESAQYIAGYVTKKMTSKLDPRLNGRHPEFARMSNGGRTGKGGIGAGALDALEDFFYTDVGARLLMQTKDVPLSLRHGGRSLPLGRYLRRKLRDRLQIPQPTAFDNPHIKRSLEEMSALFAAEEASSKPEKLAAYQKLTRPQIRSLEGRSKIFTKEKKI